MRTVLISDQPVADDAFGGHNRIACRIADIVRSDGRTNPHSIALLGDWGSGKSSVVRILRRELSGDVDCGPQDCAFFLYDSWAHEGDGLRRAFLDAFREQFQDIIGEASSKKLERETWDSEETTTTTTEPVLRPHGKALLISALATPFGISLFGSYPDGWWPTHEWLWDIVMLLLATLPIWVASYLALMRSIGSLDGNLTRFGVESRDELDDISLTNIFFQKVEGHTDHKRTTNPKDSIVKFRTAFRSLCERILEHRGRIVIVVDNLDRLERLEARAFWSTMQAFFDRSGWMADPILQRVWIIVPFASKAISRYFGDRRDADSAAEAEAFVDKSFDISFHVPTPIHVDSRSFLLGQLKFAFPDHNITALENVRDIYESYRSGGRPLGSAGDTTATRKTPRQMKLFVNQLVALFRTQSHDVSLETMTAYLLHKEVIETDGLEQVNLPPFERSLIPSRPDLIQQLAAVHFAVDMDTAAQVVLAPLIRDALRNGNPVRLKGLCERSGFAEVLESVVAEYQRPTTTEALGLAVTIREGHGSPVTLHTIWPRVLRLLASSPRLGEISNESAQLFAELARDLLPIDQAAKLDLWRVAGRSSSIKTDPDDPRSWARFAHEVSALAPVADLPRIMFDNSTFVVRAVEVLSNLREGPSVVSAIKFVGKESVSVGAVAEGAPFASPRQYVALLKQADGLDIDWKSEREALVQRLCSKDSVTFEADLRLLVASVGTDWVALIDLAPDLLGHGEFLLNAESPRVSIQCLGLILAFVSAFYPGFNSSTFSRTRAVTHPRLTSILTKYSADSKVTKAASAFAQDNDFASQLLANVAANSTQHLAGIAVVKQLLAGGGPIQLSRDDLEKAQPFIAGPWLHPPEVTSLFQNLTKKDDLLEEFLGRPLDTDSEYVAFQFYRVTTNEESRQLRTRLASLVRKADAPTWKSAIRRTSRSVIEIASYLRTHSTKDAVGEAALDGIILAIGEFPSIEVSRLPRIKQNVHGIAGALKPAIYQQLPTKVWDAVERLKDGGAISAAIDVLGEILLKADVDPDRAVDGFFAHLLTPGLTQPAVVWLATFISSRERSYAKNRKATGRLRQLINSALSAQAVEKSARTELWRLRRTLPDKDKRKRLTRKASTA